MLEQTSISQQNDIDWKGFFGAVSQQFSKYYLNFIKDNRDHYTILNSEEENLLSGLQAIYKDGDFYSYYDGVHRLMGYLLARNKMTQAESLIHVDNNFKTSRTKHEVIVNALKGQLADAKGDLDQSRICFDYVLSQINIIEAIDLRLDFYIQYFIINIKQLNHSKAEELIPIIDELVAHHPNSASCIKYFIGKARLSAEKGEMAESISIYHKASELAVRCGRDDLACGILGNLGATQSLIGQYEDALVNSMSSLEIAQKAKFTLYESQALQTLGLLEIHKGNFLAAIDLLTRAYKAAQKFGHATAIHRIKMNLGVAYEELKRFEEAQEVYLELLPYFQESKTHDLIICLINLGLVSLQLGKTEKAENYLKLSVIHAKNSGLPLYIANSLIDLGLFYTEVGEWESGIDVLEEGYLIAKLNQFEDLKGEALFRMARCFWGAGKHDKADKLSAKSQAILEAIENFQSKEVKEWREEYF